MQHTYNFPRGKLPDGRWRVDHPDRVDAVNGGSANLGQELKRLFPDRHIRVRCNADRLSIMIEDKELTAEELADKELADEELADEELAAKALAEKEQEIVNICVSDHKENKIAIE